MIRRFTQRAGILIFFAGLLGTSAYGQASFSFDSFEEWIEVEPPRGFIATGRHQLSESSRVWVFLRDRYGNLFLQNPAVELFSDQSWQATNIVMGDGIVSAWAVAVDSQGVAQIQSMIENGEWSVKEPRLKSLSGYQRLSNVSLIRRNPAPLPEPAKVEKEVPSESLPPPAASPSPASKGSLMVADFELGKEQNLAGGKLDVWAHGTKDQKGQLEITLAVAADGDRKAASVTLSKNNGQAEGNWTGGGLVLEIGAEKQTVDVSQYQYLQFDIRVSDVGNLRGSAIKIEDGNKSSKAERAIEKYGKKLSTEWQTIKIPLTDFQKLSRYEKSDLKWESLDLTQVSKIVTVSVKSRASAPVDGTLWLDNIQFTQE